jgi:PAS domain S-box-containing protein
LSSDDHDPARDHGLPRHADAPPEADPQENSLLEMILEAGQLGTWDWDIPSGRVLYGGRWLAMLGYTPGEIAPEASSWERLVHPDDAEEVHRVLTEHLEGRSDFYACEHRLLHKDGSWRWILDRGKVVERDAEGRPLRAVGTHTDATERRLAELALARERELLQAIIDRIPVMITVYTPSVKLLRINREFERVIGWTAAEATEISIMEACYPDPAYREEVARFMGTCEGWMDMPMRVRDGRDVQTSWANVRISDQTQIGIGIDISDRKRMEETLRDADRRKDEFLASLAHELRNPLAPILNGIHILRHKSPPDAELGAVHGMIDRQLRHMVRLVDDLLDVSRITRGKLELRRQFVALAEVVGHAVEQSRPHLEARGQALRVNLPADPVQIFADPVRLAQVLGNLLHNASKYSKPGGSIDLEAAREGGFITLRVRDEGIGIQSEHLPEIFEMFSQVPAALEHSEGGLGIGLALVQGLIERHGGEVEAFSEGFGRGSVFTVRLPLHEDQAPTGEDQDALAGGVPTTLSLRILVVDDNRDSADSLAMMLRLSGHQVQAVYEGESAVALARTWLPDVVLLDIGMPLIDGYETCRRIRAEPCGRGMLLIAQTGWGAEEDRRRTREAGFDGHLVKPVDLDQLRSILSAIRAR